MSHCSVTSEVIESSIRRRDTFWLDVWHTFWAGVRAFVVKWSKCWLTSWLQDSLYGPLVDLMEIKPSQRTETRADIIRAVCVPTTHTCVDVGVCRVEVEVRQCVTHWDKHGSLKAVWGTNGLKVQVIRTGASVCRQCADGMLRTQICSLFKSTLIINLTRDSTYVTENTGFQSDCFSTLRTRIKYRLFIL